MVIGSPPLIVGRDGQWSSVTPVVDDVIFILDELAELLEPDPHLMPGTAAERKRHANTDALKARELVARALATLNEHAETQWHEWLSGREVTS